MRRLLTSAGITNATLHATLVDLLGGDRTVGLVDLAMFPHVDHPKLSENTMAAAERWAAGPGIPSYAIDDDTAIRVVDGTVDVNSESHWRRFDPNAAAG